MWSRVKTRISRLSKGRKIAGELSRLSDRELEDIGIRRVDIHRFARRAATMA